MRACIYLYLIISVAPLPAVPEEGMLWLRSPSVPAEVSTEGPMLAMAIGLRGRRQDRSLPLLQVRNRKATG